MKWGNIKESFSGFCWKRLSDHEVDPMTSNGHEFQGVNALRSILGNQRRPEIPTDYYLIGDDSSDKPTVVEAISATASWYDSREKNPARSAEWRLYYPGQAGRIQNLCKAGDLMIIGMRTTGKLAVFLIQQNSSAEAAFINLLQICIDETKRASGVFPLVIKEGDLSPSALELIENLALSMEGLDALEIPPPIPLNEPDSGGDHEVQQIAGEMYSMWPERLGTCLEIEQLIFKITAISCHDICFQPDDTLFRWLEVAEGAYRIWERLFFAGCISPLRYDSSITDTQLVEQISRLWMSLRQSRVSRAGTMMELFLCRIFNASGLKYERGASIEGGKLPDFVFPGGKEYRDLLFPASHLRILGAKTSFKERWRQILAEADRVDRKHAVTRDISITNAMFRQMHDASFFVVIPEPLRKQYVFAPPNLN